MLGILIKTLKKDTEWLAILSAWCMQDNSNMKMENW